LWLHSLKVAQLLRSAACLHTNQSRSYLNHLVFTLAGHNYRLLDGIGGFDSHRWQGYLWWVFCVAR